MLKKDSTQSKNPLESFMKNQAKSKIERKNEVAKKAEEKAAEEDKKVQEAKKESLAQSQNYDKTRMIFRLILENSIKYVVLTLLLIGFVFIVIKAVPAFFAMFHQFMIGAITGK